MTLLNRALETRIVKDLGWQKWAAGGSSPMGASSTHVTPSSAMGLLSVYGSVQIITQQISTLPVKVYNRNGPTRDAVAPPMWLRRPNESCPTVIDLLTQVTTSLLLDGNAYMVPYYDGAGRPVEVYVLDPTKVQVERINGQIVYKVDGRPIPTEVRHMRGLVMPGELKGLSPVEAARLAISGGLAAAQQARTQFDNGTVAPGVIEYPGALTQTQRTDQAQAWDESQAGKGRNRPLVLMNGAQWKNISLTPEQAQFLESRQFTDAQIAGMLFNIDPAELGISVSGSGKIEYQNVESRGITLARKTLLPWIKRIEAGFDSLLPTSQYVKLSLDGLQRPDLTTRYTAYETGVSGGWLTVSEVRALEDMPPLDEPVSQPVRFDSATLEVREVQPPTVNLGGISVHLPAQTMNVDATSQHRHDVTLTPEIYNEITTPEPRVDVVVTGVEQPAPVVNVVNEVNPTPVTVQNEVNVDTPPAQVTVVGDDKPSRFKVRRDSDGRIDEVDEV